MTNTDNTLKTGGTKDRVMNTDILTNDDIDDRVMNTDILTNDDINDRMMNTDDTLTNDDMVGIGS